MSDVLSWIRLPGPLLIGHRGYAATAPENTPSAFEAAIEAGCDGVELDVRATLDGTLVVHHDAATPGPRGSVEIATVPWSELETEIFQGPAGPYRISRLEEILDGLSRRCLVNVEVKPPGSGRHATVARGVLAALERVRPRESVLVSSFDPGVLAAFREATRDTLLGFLFSSIQDWNELEQDELALSLTALHPREDLADRRLLKRAKERGLLVHVWTVNDPARAERLVAEGARALITDRPDILEEVVK